MNKFSREISGWRRDYETECFFLQGHDGELTSTVTPRWRKIGTGKTFVNGRLCPASVDMWSKDGSHPWSHLERLWAATASMVATGRKLSADDRRWRRTGRHGEVCGLHVHPGVTDARFPCLGLDAYATSLGRYLGVLSKGKAQDCAATECHVRSWNNAQLLHKWKVLPARAEIATMRVKEHGHAQCWRFGDEDANSSTLQSNTLGHIDGKDNTSLRSGGSREVRVRITRRPRTKCMTHQLDEVHDPPNTQQERLPRHQITTTSRSYHPINVFIVAVHSQIVPQGTCRTDRSHMTWLLEEVAQPISCRFCAQKNMVTCKRATHMST